MVIFEHAQRVDTRLSLSPPTRKDKESGDEARVCACVCVQHATTKI